MAYRFVHAADIHLDSPLRSLALRNPDLATMVGDASRQAFGRIVDLCLDEQVDALLLAGDLYDGDQTSMKTARFLAEQLRRLDAAGIRTFVIRGNHDALSKITRELVLPDSVKVFGDRADAAALKSASGGLDVVVHGLSFKDAKAPKSLLPSYRAPVTDAVNIGLMHTSLGGADGHNPYAPCSIADLQASGFAYWALGHIHVRGIPVARGARDAVLVMPGIPQGRDIGEAGPKSVTLVTVRDDRSLIVEERVTSVAQFDRVPVDLGGVEDWADTVGRIAAALGRARDAAASPHLVARLAVTGETPLAWQIRRDADRLKTEADIRAAEFDGVWVEKVELAVVPPGGVADRGDAVAELGELIGATVLDSEAFRSGMAAVVEELSRKLPTECRNRVMGADGEASGTALARLFAEGAEDVLARLREPAGTEPA